MLCAEFSLCAFALLPTTVVCSMFGRTVLLSASRCKPLVSCACASEWAVGPALHVCRAVPFQRNIHCAVASELILVSCNSCTLSAIAAASLGMTSYVSTVYKACYRLRVLRHILTVSFLAELTAVIIYAQCVACKYACLLRLVPGVWRAVGALFTETVHVIPRVPAFQQRFCLYTLL